MNHRTGHAYAFYRTLHTYIVMAMVNIIVCCGSFGIESGETPSYYLACRHRIYRKSGPLPQTHFTEDKNPPRTPGLAGLLNCCTGPSPQLRSFNTGQPIIYNSVATRFYSDDTLRTTLHGWLLVNAFSV